jgi:hypothetical protein
MHDMIVKVGRSLASKSCDSRANNDFEQQRKGWDGKEHDLSLMKSSAQQRAVQIL